MMNRKYEFTRKCSVTGKDEKWERIEMKTKPYGQGGQVTPFIQENCLNYKCALRDTAQCPYKK